ncbi:DNA-binding protein kinase TEL1 [Sporobolomyces koalae]|uniref:DNA-binding protein kinase TEL1 n=1 Tax=Sporobolomyces koalae TaxID=500713 RepID=UPI0031774D3C
MSVMREWAAIKELLESDKIKQRAEGLSRCREFLSVKRNFRALSEDRRHSWLETLQSIFYIVIIERNASVSGKSAATGKRLEEAAQMVRWLAEKVYRLLPRKSAKALINHLTQMISVSGKIQLYALTYAKALRTVLSHPPHLEHLDERQWTDITTLCFSAVLGEKVKIGTEFSESEAMDLDQDETLGGALRESAGDEFALPTPTKRTANALEIELVGCLEVVFRSNSSPFIAHARAIFRKFLRFFRMFPSETTAHLSALVALNRAFSELDLNDQRSMRDLGPHLWPAILALWPTKNANLKEQVVISLRYLFPFVIPRSHPHRSTNEPSATLRANELYQAVLTEPTIRWREPYVLNLDHLSLGLNVDGLGRSKAFDSRTFRLGNEFDEKDAIAWSIAELGADALARVYEMSEAVEARADDEMSATARGKRRKIDDPLSLLLDSISDTTQPLSVSLFRTQILLFLVERHQHCLEAEAKRRILTTAAQLLSSSLDVRLQSWNLLLVAAIALDDAAGDFDKNGLLKVPGRQSDAWSQVWTALMRKISVAETCRAGAHAANLVLAADRINAISLTESIETLARDLELQGPNFASDSVCRFFEWCLAITGSDSQLFRLRLPDKLLNWITSAWRPLEGVSRSHSFGQARPSADPFSPSGLVLLIGRLTNSPVTPAFLETTFIPDCPVATQALELSDTARVRDFIEARVPAYRPPQSSFRTPSSVSSSLSGGTQESEETRRRRISAWLTKMLEALLEEAEGRGDAHWTSMSLDLARRHLDLATATLCIESLISLSATDRSHTPALRHANTIIIRLAPTLALHKWQPTERAYLLHGLDLLFVPMAESNDVEYPVFLDAGSASGISREPVQATKTAPTAFDPDSPLCLLLRAMWKSPSTREALEEILSALRFILGAVTRIESSPSASGSPSQVPSTQASQRLKELEATQKTDDFDNIKVTSRAAQTVGTLTARRATQAYIAMCVRGFASCEMASTGSIATVRLVEIVDAITSAEGEDGIILAEQALKAAKIGLVSFGLAQCDSFLTYLGNDLLPNYRYARDERFHLVSLRFLECVSSTWVKAEGSTEDFGTLARQLCDFYINALRKTVLSSWRIRLQLIAVFDDYLKIDPALQFWRVGSALVTSDDGTVISPNNIIPFMLSDADFRVRFRAASSAPRLFQVYYEIGLGEQPLIEDIKANLTFNLAETEQVLTQVLANANMMIASAAHRRAPYDLLLDTVAKNNDLRESVIASLVAVSERLGLSSLSALYLEYARYIIWLPTRHMSALPEDEQVCVDLVQQLPFRAAGYTSLREARRADFRRTASWLLQSEHTQDAFNTMCAVIKRTPQEGRLECLAETVALAIIRHRVRQYFTPDLPISVLREQLQRFAEDAGAGDAHVADTLLASIADDVTVEALSETHEANWSQHQLLAALENYDRVAAGTFHDILELAVDLTFDFEPPPPHYQVDSTVPAVILFHREYPVLNSPAAMFSIVQKLLAKVHAASFVAQRQRYLVALGLAISLGHRVVNEPIILGALGHGLVELLPQFDLLAVTVPILTWTIKRWFAVVPENKKNNVNYRELAGQLVRAAHATAKLRQVDERVEAIDRFSVFLDDALRQLCRTGEGTAIETCLLWPSVVVNTSTFTQQEVYAALTSDFRPISKFAFVKALKERDDIVTGSVSGRMLWRLLQAIESPQDLSTQDCGAFAELAYNAGGRIEAPSLIEAGQDGLLRDDCVPTIENEGGIKRALLVRVLHLLKSKDRTLVSSAFDTAKLIASVASSKDELLPLEFDRQVRPIVTLLFEPSLLRPQYLRKRFPRTLSDLSDAEWIDKAGDYDVWVRSFAELLADVRAESDAFYAQLVPLIKTSVQFSSIAIPHLLHSILSHAHTSSDPDVAPIVSRYVSQLLQAKTIDMRTISVLVKAAVHLRRHPRTDLSATSASRFDKWLTVPWLLLAKGAVTIGSFFDGLLFLELAREYDHLFQEQAAAHQDSRSDAQAQDLLYHIYSKIDEPDGFYGRESNDIRQSLVNRYRHEGRWQDAFSAYGARYEAQAQHLGSFDRSATAGVVVSLASFGFNRLASSMLEPARLDGSLQDGNFSPDLPYELAWRTDCWDLPVERRAAGTSSAHLYSALQAVRSNRPIADSLAIVDNCLIDEVAKLANVGLESPNPEDKVISTILALREVKSFADIGEGDNITAERLKGLAVVPADFSFEQAEIVLSTRISRLRAVRARERLESVGDAFESPISTVITSQERTCLIELSRRARKAGHLQVALNATTFAHTLADETSMVDVDCELAHVLWAQREHTSAINLLKKVNERSGRKNPLVWATLGEWTGEAHIRKPSQVLEDYFDPAIRTMQPTTTPSDRAHIFQAFADFADQQYQELSKATEEKRARFAAYNRRKTIEFEEMDRQRKSNSGGNTLDSNKLERSKLQAKAHLVEDRQQLEEAERTTRNMLSRAIENYSRALAESDGANDKVFRFCALWLAHADSEELHVLLKPLLAAIPSHKFVFLAYQLSARLSVPSRPSTSAKNIRRLVQRLCKEHTFHAFFPIHALREAPSQSKSSRRSSTTKGDIPKNSRAQAAADVIEHVKEDDRLRSRIESLELACDAYGEWAAFRLKDSAHYVDNRGAIKKGELKILPSMRIRSKLNDQPIPVSTFDLPIDPTGQYPDGSFPHIVGYAEYFDTAGGIHVPKIVTCLGSDGKHYRQLLKGDDEVRQDAVMEQIFVLVNDLLKRDIGTRRRKLHIRTYKVIPLPDSNGLIEFVANTTPLGSCLQRLYDQMHPQTPQNARAALGKLERAHKSSPEVMNELKLATFLKTLGEMPPLMRHLFWQRQKVPSLWFEMRLNYSRSVATTSMIGYILGLGDRHVSNILMDESTGELVHIDFGIAFEQGKRLPIPELVPFRLTQNLVDGFGASGVDGVFRRSSEETLRVLRDRSNILMTVLEVFKHDPLQNWAVSSEMAKRIQGSEEAEGLDDLPDDADRALAIVRSKLDTRLSVQYSVNQVIQEATDARNLSSIFSGWQPYY